MKFEDRSQEETERQQRCAQSKAWNLAKNIQAQRKRQGCILLSRGGMGTPGCEPEERDIRKSPTTVVTANGEVLVKEAATENVREFEKFVAVMLLEDTLAVLSLGKLCKGLGYSYHRSGQKPHLIKDGRKIKCNTPNNVPFVVLGLSMSSSTSSSPPTSSSKDTVTTTQIPAAGRSESTNEAVRRNPSHEQKTQIKMTTTKNYKVMSCKVSQIGYRISSVDWLMKVFQNIDTLPVLLMKLPMEPRTKLVSGKHNMFTHFPNDRNCDICLRTKITRASCRRRAGTVVPRAQSSK